MKTINVNFDGFEYPIIIGNNIIGNIADHVESHSKNNKILIVTDENLKDFDWLETISDPFESKGYEVHVVYINGGKGNKTLKVVTELYTLLEKNKFARDSTMIALGGGVIGDLAGFVASTWFRGMNLVHVPTTLTAMIDSSVGGKVAINFKDTINAVGNYHHPICNVIDLKFIKTLPDREYIAGMAEVIKCAVINDRHFFDYLMDSVNSILGRDEDAVLYLINRTIQIKIDHVTNDIREGGKRLLLNYGHTLGHAIEMTTTTNGVERYRHGEGVALGMMAVVRIAEKFLNVNLNIRRQLKEMLELYGLPTSAPSPESVYNECLKVVKLDKKRKDNQIRLILATEIGSATVFGDVPFDLIEDAFAEVLCNE